MQLRNLTINDREQFSTLMMGLHDYHVNNRPDIYKCLGIETSSKSWGFESLLKNKNCILIGAEINGDLAGICVMTIREPSKNPCVVPRVRVYIDDICVSEEYRRKGIGTALYDKAVQYARQIKADSIELMVWNFNKIALEFYKSLGMSVQSYIMEKKL